MAVPPAREVPGQAAAVTPLELFFDVVFVFAVSQLSHHLSTDVSLRGATETLVMLIAVFGAWFTTSWTATLIGAERSRTRWLMLTVMFLGLFMNVAITRAFSSSPWAFVVPLLLIQVGRAGWTLLNATDRWMRDHYIRTILWVTATAPLWAIGALVDSDIRLLFWCVAAGIDLLGRWLAHPIPGRWLQSENIAFDADHMLERCRLFLIIALGETVFTTGTTLTTEKLDFMTVLTGTTALAGTVALWSLTFGRLHSIIVTHAETTSDPILASRHAADSLMVLTAGLIALAVANELVISHPHASGSVELTLLLSGGPILYLAAHAWYLWAVPGTLSRLHFVAVAALALLGLVTLAVEHYVAIILIGGCLVAIAAADYLQIGTSSDQERRHAF